MSGISVSPGSGVVINGIRVDMVADHAIAMAKGAEAQGSTRPDEMATEKAVQDAIFSGVNLTPQERDIADRASRLLLKMRREGYSKEHTHAHFWRVITDEAGKVTSAAVN